MAPISAAPHDSDGRSLGGALGDVWRDASTLLQQHAALAASELSDRASGLGIDALLLVSGIVLLHAATLAFLVAAAFGLYGAGLKPWQAGVVVAVAATLMGAGLMLLGLGRLRRRTAGPSDTLLSFKESGQWLTTLTHTHQG